MTEGSVPEGFVAPTTVWAVETDDLGVAAQLGAFTTEEEARRLIALLAGEGRWTDLHLNLISVHERVDDWEWDR